MIIDKFHPDDYYRITNPEIELAPHVTMIFGENGSGKSRLLDAIHQYVSYKFLYCLDNGQNRISVNCFKAKYCFGLEDLEPVIVENLGENPFSNFMRECFRSFMKGFGRFEIIDLCEGKYDSKLYLRNKSGDYMPINDLPSSYRRLFHIIVEIAISLYLTKKDLYVNGFVLIDDIDLHLGPVLQQTIIERFTRTFPNVQFVVTTHSPIVLSHLPQDKNNRIYQIVSDGHTCSLLDMSDVYGLDYNSVVSLAMGAQERDPHVQAIKDRYVRLMRRGNTVKAALAAEEIRRWFPDSYEAIMKELDEKVN